MLDPYRARSTSGGPGGRHGLILFDAGLSSRAAGDPAAVYGPGADAFGMHFTDQMRLDRQLADLEYTCKDVSTVVLSHAHFDHTGGLDLFGHAEGYVGAGELRWGWHPDPIVAGSYNREDLEAAAKLTWNELPAGYDHDLFGDGTITLLSLPGHTIGSLGLRLRVGEQTLVLTGDAAHLQESLDNVIGMPFDQSSTNKIASLQKLRLLRRQVGTTVWVNHDPDDYARYRGPNGAVVLGEPAQATTAPEPAVLQGRDDLAATLTAQAHATTTA